MSRATSRSYRHREERSPGVRWASTAVILPGGVGGGEFHPGGGEINPRGGGHAPQGRPITASEGEQGSAQNNKTKKIQKQNTKTHPKMLLIGCLGGHAPSGENQWVEGQRGQTAGQRAAAGAGGPLRRGRWRHQSQDCQAWGQRAWTRQTVSKWTCL